MLPEVAVLLPADGAGRSELVVDVVDVSLQVGLQIAAVATLCALEVFNLKYIIVIELGELEGVEEVERTMEVEEVDVPACAAG